MTLLVANLYSWSDNLVMSYSQGLQLWSTKNSAFNDLYMSVLLTKQLLLFFSYVLRLPLIGSKTSLINRVRRYEKHS
jgi:hypothetical protein